MENKKDYQYRTFRLPIWWVPPLFNADSSAISDEENKEIDSFIREIKGEATDVDWKSEDFEPYPDSGGLADTCVNITFRINN